MELCESLQPLSTLIMTLRLSGASLLQLMLPYLHRPVSTAALHEIDARRKKSCRRLERGIVTQSLYQFHPVAVHRGWGCAQSGTPIPTLTAAAAGTKSTDSRSSVSQLPREG
eukprot:535788-Rhodomonas_salina.2